MDAALVRARLDECAPCDLNDLECYLLIKESQCRSSKSQDKKFMIVFIASFLPLIDIFAP